GDLARRRTVEPGGGAAATCTRIVRSLPRAAPSELSPLLRGPAHLAHGHLDADGGAVVAGAEAVELSADARHSDVRELPADIAGRAVCRGGGRSCRSAPANSRRADTDDAERVRAGGADLDRSGAGRARGHAGGVQRDRQFL